MNRRSFLRGVAAGAVVTLADGLHAADPAGKRKFRFASWNIGHFALGKDNCSKLTPGEAAGKSAVYRAFLADVGADFLGIAEYSDGFTRDGSVRADDAVFAGYDRKKIGPRHDWQWNAQFWKGFALEDARMKEYARRLQGVYYLATTLNVFGEKVTFVQTHLDWGSFYEGHELDRADQMLTLVEDFRDVPRVVIAGDFNIGIRFADRKKKSIDNPIEYKVFEQAGYTLGNDGRYKTCPSGAPTCALDNIIVKGLGLSGFMVADRPDLSDHALVYADLAL